MRRFLGNIYTGWVIVVALALVAAHPRGAHAYLGGNADTITKDAVTLSARVSVKQPPSKPTYTVQEMMIAGTQVREYLTATGSNSVVFAIAWKGHHHPPFRKLLGAYGAEYDEAFKKDVAQKPLHHGSRSRDIRSEHLVVQYSGHFRNMNGRAYVPSLVPAGVDPNAIQ